ncbi:hypothetical protein [Staphylococcus saprophyticus]|uniref:hypothetical protein n=1 Tax=Staphylococcus saprophyticus TaxID=29385 RepID=UPI0034DCCDB0
MKIKRKVQKNLPQLIEWAWKNNVKGEFFSIDQNEESGIYFATNNDFMMKDADYIRYNDTFTIEVEEEITEDTIIPEMLLVFNNGVTHLVENSSLNYLDTSCLKSAYTMNDDLRLILIWRDGKLVE